MITTEIHTAFTLPRLLRCVPKRYGKVTTALVDFKLKSAPSLVLAAETKSGSYLMEISSRGGEYIVDVYRR